MAKAERPEIAAKAVLRAFRGDVEVLAFKDAFIAQGPYGYGMLHASWQLLGFMAEYEAPYV